jgi:hypothetical protein
MTAGRVQDTCITNPKAFKSILGWYQWLKPLMLATRVLVACLVITATQLNRKIRVQVYSDIKQEPISKITKAKMA